MSAGITDLLDSSVDEVPPGTRAAGGAAPVDDGPAPSSAKLRFRSLVKNAPVVGFTGANGAGKTLVAVSEAIHDLSRGRRVVSTVQINSRFGSSEPLKSLRQLLDLRDCTVLIDEVSVVLSSRSTGSLPEEAVTFLQSLRHQGITLRWTAPAWMRADVLLREVTQVSVGVTGIAKYTKRGAFWPTPRVILAGAMDCVGIPLDARPERVVGRRFWVPSHLPGWGAYDSEADVSRIGWAKVSGACVDCGGSIPRPKCDPARHVEMGLAPPIKR